MNVQICIKHGCALVNNKLGTDLSCPMCQREIAESVQPPTNEPKMPEVIYATIENRYWYNYPLSVASSTPYHHEDKVQELKEAYRKLINDIASLQDEDDCYCLVSTCHYCRTKEILTKASNLLK